jgi:hypothetical protein
LADWLNKILGEFNHPHIYYSSLWFSFGSPLRRSFLFPLFNSFRFFFSPSPHCRLLHMYIL